MHQSLIVTKHSPQSQVVNMEKLPSATVMNIGFHLFRNPQKTAGPKTQTLCGFPLRRPQPKIDLTPKPYFLRILEMGMLPSPVPFVLSRGYKPVYEASDAWEYVSLCMCMLVARVCVHVCICMCMGMGLGMGMV